jgi:ABC-type multidrug transport system fused ATPase/permease subunit
MFSASRRLFDMLLQAVLRAPMDFTDRNPLGRIMNRFTSDTAILDEQVGQVLGSALTTALTLLAIFGVGSSVSWWTLPMSLPMLLMCTYSALQFFQVARKLKHLDNISRSPILESFCSTMDGLPTIRSMLLQERYTIKFGALVDDNTRALWNLWLVNAWFGCRMALIGSIFVTTATLVIVSMPGVTVAMTGFALGFLLRYTDTVSAFVRNFINLDLALTSTSRILEYINIPSEDYSGGRLPPASWPESGRVRISDLVVRHAPHLPPALDHVSFEIGPNERVGVVGRTGAGKSTLAMAFFRILEAEQGSISLDGINIAEVALQQLRQRLSIITQDPHLFFGTVRTNLDPFGTHDDTDLLHSLEQVHWPGCRDRHGQEDDPTSGPGLFSSPNTDDVTGRNAKSMHALSLLEQPIMDGGSNLSQGQRQQLSLARAIVDRSRLLILDEATSSMDPIVDASIQKSIRELSACGFASMLVIAHRIGTVMDFDKIIVLDKGVVVESGSPGELLKLPGGYFRGLAEDARETVKEAESQEMVVETGDDMEGLFVQESTYTSASRAVETRQSVSQSVVRRQSGAHCVETRHMQR